MESVHKLAATLQVYTYICIYILKKKSRQSESRLKSNLKVLWRVASAPVCWNQCRPPGGRLLGKTKAPSSTTPTFNRTSSKQISTDWISFFGVNEMSPRRDALWVEGGGGAKGREEALFFL